MFSLHITVYPEQYTEIMSNRLKVFINLLYYKYIVPSSQCDVYATKINVTLASREWGMSIKGNKQSNNKNIDNKLGLP